jgi:hypothetical protein
MNAQLRKEIYKKRMLFNKHTKTRSQDSWDDFKRQRNYVTLLKRKSIRKYFLDRCTRGQNSKDFWPTVKPFLSKKHHTGQKKIVLESDGKIINKSSEVCEKFNSYFVNVAKDIGKHIVTFSPETHTSVKAIEENKTQITHFDFNETDTDTVEKIINKINSKKATGADNFPAKLLKIGSPVLSRIITNLINSSITSGVFPDKLILALVTPLYKKTRPS